MSGKATDPVARFWRKVDRSGSCWQWLGKPHKSGYGRHSPTPGAIVYAHRFAYELLVGPIPPELQLDHLCRNKMCVRPDHLESVTQQVNLARGLGACAENARKTECNAGHPLSGANVHIYTIRSAGTLGRRCRACAAENARRGRRSVVAA